MLLCSYVTCFTCFIYSLLFWGVLLLLIWCHDPVATLNGQPLMPGQSECEGKKERKDLFRMRVRKCDFMAEVCVKRDECVSECGSGIGYSKCTRTHTHTYTLGSIDRATANQENKP